MEMSYLKAFYEVAKAGRFSEAAQRLNISQSALSRSVALLEEGEGVQLFLRSKRGVTLTPLGQQVFEKCSEIFADVQEIERLCRGTREVCEGPLVFMTTDHIVNDVLIQPLQKFLQKYPQVIPNIPTGSPDEIIQGLLQTDCEFGLSLAKVIHPQIEYQILKPNNPMLLVCQADLWKKSRSSSDLKTLKKVLEQRGYIGSRDLAKSARSIRVLEELFGEVPRMSLQTSNQEAQKRFCLAGGGIAYLARFMVENEIAQGRLIEVPELKPHTFHLWVARRKDRKLTLQAQTFLTELKKQNSL